MVKVRKDLLRSSRPNPSSSRLPRSLSWFLSISKEEDSTTFLGNLFHCSVTGTVQKHFLMLRWNLLYSRLCPLLLVLGTDEKSLTVLRCILHCYLEKWVRTPWPPSSPGWTVPGLSDFLHGVMLQFTDHLGGPPFNFFHYIHLSLVLGNPELDQAL